VQSLSQKPHPRHSIPTESATGTASATSETGEMAEEDDASRRSEELEALRCFYEEDFLGSEGGSCDSRPAAAAVGNSTPEADGPWRIRVAPRVVLVIQLPSDYPSASAPVPFLKAPHWALDEGRRTDLIAELEEMILPDTEMAILWAEHCRAELADVVDDDRTAENDCKVTSADENVGGKICTDTEKRRDDEDAILAVVEFHHMLIGKSHKKESEALSAAANIVRGWIFMGGPSVAVVQATKTDLQDWVQACKRAGKTGDIRYWRLQSKDGSKPLVDFPTKLKTMGYASGKEAKMDTVEYKKILSNLEICFPLPKCSLLL